MSVRTVIVGTDGAASSSATVEWAAREAGRRGASLRIVHILEWNDEESRESAGNSYVERVWAASDSLTATAARRAREVAPEIAIRSDTLIGHPAARILELARDAELIVLGSRGRGGFAGLRLGSVSLRVATHAPCPVAVVRGTPVAGAPVFAGIHGSPATDHVLETAFEAAVARAAALVVVRAFAPAKQPWAPPDQDDVERDRIEEQLAPWRQKFPDVPVEIRLAHETVAATLENASAEGQLMIVGSHSRGVVRGALLGSTGLHLLQHAACPVLITRPLNADPGSPQIR